LAAVSLPITVESSEVAIPARTAPSHIPSLDGLRAASFLLVFAAHAGLDGVVPGAFGVTVFFFLSGYLITTLMRTEIEKTGRVSLKDFYLRRALRILPPFYLVLVAATVLAHFGLVRGDLEPMAVASQALHLSNYWIATHGWSGIAQGTGVYWSLAVEEHFYLLFPMAFVGLSRLRLTGRATASGFWGLCALVLAWRCVLVFALHTNVERVQLCSDTRIDSIAFGCALAVWRNPVIDGAGSWPESPLWGRLLVPGGVALLLLTFLVREPHFRETFRYTLQGIGLTPIFLMAVRRPRWHVFRLLSWRPVQFIGTLSYTLYLVHHVALEGVALHSPSGPVVNALLALLVSVAIAWAMHLAVEKPLASLRRRLRHSGSPA
jgi:peptidoglycan/LPS O-acetylase OafA/YrhL